MRRRVVLGATAGALCTAGQPVTAAAQSIRQEIAELNERTVTSAMIGNRALAFDRGLTGLSRLSRRDAAWGSYRESAQLARLLFLLSNQQVRDVHLRVCQLVVDSWSGGASVNGLSMTDNYKLLCSACVTVLENPQAFRSMRTSRGETAVILLCYTAMMQGPERQQWAQLGLREMRAHGQQAAREWSRDNMTGRWLAVGAAVAGDHRSARDMYEPVLATAAGAMQDIVEQPRRGIIANMFGSTEGIGGVASTMAGFRMLRAEGATLAYLNGDMARGAELLEQSRAPAISAASRELGDGADAAAIERELVLGGATIVQVAATQIGCLAVVSTLRNGLLHRHVEVDYEAGGALMLDLLAGWYNAHVGFSRQPGLLQMYDAAHRAPARRQHAEMLTYTGVAQRAAQAVVGETLNRALTNAGVTAEDDVLIVAPASLSILPLGLARGPSGRALSETFALRFATSLSAARRSEQRRQRHIDALPVVCFASTATRRPLPHARFERASVMSHFSADRQQEFRAPTDAASALASMQGASYWHIASHGVWNFREQDESGLLMFRNRPTTVAHIADFRAEPSPRLVFLSACETNMLNTERDITAFVGLHTAFLEAGAAGVIGTQWTVSDAAASLFAAKFYDAHMREGLTPGRALRAAQVWLQSSSTAALSTFVDDLVSSGRIDAALSEGILGYLADLQGEHPFADPYYWGGYQLFGA